MFDLVFIVRFTSFFAMLEGFLSLGFVHLKITTSTKAIHKKREPKEEKREPKEVSATKKEAGIKRDPTKQKSLQPGNRRSSPEENAKKLEQQIDDASFVHDFFGSKLVVNNATLVSNLSRKKHRLEITGNQLFIDNDPHPINQGELERIKKVIRDSRA